MNTTEVGAPREKGAWEKARLLLERVLSIEDGAIGEKRRCDGLGFKPCNCAWCDIRRFLSENPNVTGAAPVTPSPVSPAVSGDERLEQIAHEANRKLCHNHYCGMDWDNLKIIRAALTEALALKPKEEQKP